MSVGNGRFFYYIYIYNNVSSCVDICIYIYICTKTLTTTSGASRRIIQRAVYIKYKILSTTYGGPPHRRFSLSFSLSHTHTHTTHSHTHISSQDDEPAARIALSFSSGFYFTTRADTVLTSLPPP